MPSEYCTVPLVPGHWVAVDAGTSERLRGNVTGSLPDGLTSPHSSAAAASRLRRGVGVRTDHRDGLRGGCVPRQHVVVVTQQNRAFRGDRTRGGDVRGRCDGGTG